jgi:hypothetical protein
VVPVAVGTTTTRLARLVRQVKVLLVEMEPALMLVAAVAGLQQLEQMRPHLVRLVTVGRVVLVASLVPQLPMAAGEVGVAFLVRLAQVDQAVVGRVRQLQLVGTVLLI